MRSRKTAAAFVFSLAILGFGTTAKSASLDETLTQLRENHLPEALSDLEVSTQNQILCLALNQYHEARGSTLADIKAVGFSTRNRVQKKDREYCDIIWEKGQYEWTRRAISGIIPRETAAWNRIIGLAREIVTNDELADPTGGADSFFSRKIKAPAWARRSPIFLPIGGHIYVRQLRR
jgi:N-acetylmuramoyl-L-alanine amidase